MAERQITLASQIKAVEREIAMRKAVYPKRVATRAMKPETAAHEIAAMEAILGTLRRLEWQSEACPDACDHTIAEHTAFDAGVAAGGRGDYEGSCPYVGGKIREAWLTGHSVGSNNGGDNERTANNRG
jgi:ribosome modulation factor